MNLKKNIFDHYINNQNQLTIDKSFHFNNRILAWEGNTKCKNNLKHLKHFFAEDDKSGEELIIKLFNKEPNQNMNNFHIREPFLNKYPNLYGLQLAMFRIRHLKKIYGIDYTDSLLNIVDKEDLLKLKDQLLLDKEALKVLSTIAINYLYLLRNIILESEFELDINYLYKIGVNEYDFSNSEEAQMALYLYTHCIIGESEFYTKKIPTNNLDIYKKMLKKCEEIIINYYDKVNLDNKFEFLVCARICNFNSLLFDKINNEATQSISPNGCFLIDTVNNFKQKNRSDFDKSEHRNVLYIMSQSPYEPKSISVI